MWRADTQLRDPSQSWFLSGQEWSLTGLLTASTWALRRDHSSGELTGTRVQQGLSWRGTCMVLRAPPKGVACRGWKGSVRSLVSVWFLLVFPVFSLLSFPSLPPKWPLIQSFFIYLSLSSPCCAALCRGYGCEQNS